MSLTRFYDAVALLVLPLAAIVSLAFFMHAVDGNFSVLLFPKASSGYQVIVLAFALIGVESGLRRKALVVNFVPWFSVGVIVYCWMVLVQGR